MRAVLLVAKGEGRRRIVSLIGLALIVGLVGVAVFASVAGARRTASAPDRLRATTVARDGGAFAFTLGDPIATALAEEVSALDGVAAVATAGIYPTDALFDIDVTLLAPYDDVAFATIDRPLLLDGRLPDPDAPDEVVVSELAADRLDLHTGDRFQAGTFSPADCRGILNDDFQGFNGPTVDLEVVGEVRRIEELQGGDTESGPTLVGGPGLARSLDGACAAGVVAMARYEEGGGPSDAALTAAARRAAPGAQQVQGGAIETEFFDGVRSAVDVAVVALVVFALVTGLAGLIAVVQAVLRQVEGAGGVGSVLGALGLTRGQRAMAVALPLATAGLVGSAIAVAGAVAISSRFPIGVARRAEPDPGLQVDLLALGLGAVLLVVVVVLTAHLAARRGASRAPAVDRASPSAERAARLGVAPSFSVGLGLADDRGRGRATMRTAALGVAVAVAGVCAVAVLASSLTAVADDPARFGWVWTAKPDLDSDDPDATLEALATEDDLTAVGALQQGSIELDGSGIDGFAVDVRKGSIAFDVVDGRAPTSPGEVALGAQALAGVDIGDSVETTTPDGDPLALVVVGRAVMPQFDSSGTTSAWLTSEGMTALAPDAERSLVLTYAPGAEPVALEARLEEQYGISYPTYARPNPPGRLVHLDELRGLFLAMAVFFALLGLVGLVHALAVASRRHRGGFATLRSLGFQRRQVRRAVVTCSTALVVVGTMVGVPLGIVAGRLTWAVEVGDLGIQDAPTVPLAALIAVSASAVAVAVAVGLFPAWRAGRRSPATVLRAE